MPEVLVDMTQSGVATVTLNREHSCAETGGIRAHEQAGVGRDRLNDGAIRPCRRSENLYEAESLRAVSRSRPSPRGRADCSH
jgi:hypothetical protein